MTLTPSQEREKRNIIDWFNNRSHSEPWYFLCGSAGTGKTTLVSEIAKELELSQEDEEIVYLAYTGKASIVLRQKGARAYTIHKFIYYFDKKETIDGHTELKFTLKKFLDFEPRLIVLDEVSMVPDKIFVDLLSFGIPVLCVGDHKQLPPVQGVNSYIKQPNGILTDIVRQALDSPVVRLANDILENKNFFSIDYGSKVKIVNANTIPKEIYLKADQIITGTNKSRVDINNSVRKQLGRTSHYPEEGDKLICLKNNWDLWFEEFPMVNGLIFNCEGVGDVTLPGLKRDILVEFNGFKIKTTFDTTIFDKPKDKIISHADVEMDFGYAITGHKSQGSEYDNILIIHDWNNKPTLKSWLYTVVTRAKKGILMGV